MCSLLTFLVFNAIVSLRTSYRNIIATEWHSDIQVLKPILHRIEEMNKPMAIDNLRKQKCHQFLYKSNRRNCLKVSLDQLKATLYG